jgi:hypothetical protein
MSGYDDRYADNWKQKSRETEEATGGYCCFPDCWAKGKAAHHAAYRDADGVVAGREIPGVHTFWLCNVHDSIRNPNGAHNPKNWDKGALPPPTLDAGNTPAYYLKLREGFKQKRDWVTRAKENDPNYKFQTRRNGFKKRRRSA